MRALLTLIVGVILLLAAEPAWAASDRRIALVIGNSAYRKFPSLPNPKNDAEDVTAALKRVGFTVLGGTDMTREQMRDGLRQFARAAQDAEAALVFYAGHGLQYRGRNYLVPVDAKLEDEFDLEYETVRVDDVVEELNRADGPRILVLDACRNLPLSTRSRDPFSSTGLAKLSGRGLIVAYATQANQVAYDGTGRNSIFTGAFINTVQEPGLDVAQVFQRVSMSVDRATSGRQTPELSLSYPGQFYLNKGETEREAWPRARASNDPQVLREFIAKYPNSFLVDDARDLIQRLEARAGLQAERIVTAQAERGGAPQAERGGAPQAEQRAPTLQLARRPDDAAAARAREEAERRAWQRLQEEQERRAEARRQAERERQQAEEQERQRLAQEEERRRVEARRAEQERLAEEARQKKLAEERAAAEARERQRLEREARLDEERRRQEARRQEGERLAEEARQKKLAEERAVAEARERQRAEREARIEEERRQAEARRADQERVAEEARQRKVAEERAAAEARERQRLEREARLEEERRQAELRRAEEVRLAEEARQRKLAEDRAAAEARERQRLAEEAARREEEQRRIETARAEQERQRLAAAEADRARLAAAEQAERDRLAWQQLEEQQRRRAAAAQAEVGAPVAAAPAAAQAAGEPSVQTTLDALKSARASASSALVGGGQEANAAPAGQGAAPIRLALNDPTQPAAIAPAQPSAFPKEILDGDKLVRETKAELGRIGCYDEDPDGSWDKDAAAALRRFGRQVKLSPVPTEPSPALLEDLKGRPANVCPLECGAGERAQGDRCVAVARPETKPAPRREPKPRAVAQERRAPEPRVVRPRPAPAQAPVSTAAAPRPAATPRPMMGVGF